jgi:hypothetical protein
MTTNETPDARLRWLERRLGRKVETTGSGRHRGYLVTGAELNKIARGLLFPWWVLILAGFAANYFIVQALHWMYG